MGSPELSFTHATPYDDYVGTATLRALPGPRTDAPEEPAFLVTTQVMELYFGLVRTELRLAVRLLGGPRLPEATAAIARAAAYLDVVNAAWRPLNRLTPRRFNAFRAGLGEGSGFQSALYREVEFLLGDKSASLAQVHRGNPETYRELLAALRAPSLYDAALSVLDRRGYDVPAAVLTRAPETPYRPDPQVEKAWARVYAELGPGDELWELAEALTDVSDGFTQWRVRHLAAVRRSMGAKAGTGGSSGASWLERTLRREIFPELWSARTLV
ncbi:tryptophan 2,3-dioxygenase family protein [Actinomadura sp. ATCC 31491]|uniref:Tryptophan 2,3-dioxygenase n=1 Tax=Actinomadura luzonensis TaxID=2805427 RepID=A0ABT0FXK1_9ACTN|nr:tryptophan 2,3-dioxygenase family protein [Actinomadura luzonensis]MCK2217061.1 tryptophan 2,3-dioxygenase family protein [Actinomadura luzonensis]